MNKDYITRDINKILDDVLNFEPVTITGMVNFVRNHDKYKSIILLINNSNAAIRYLVDQCLTLISYNNIVDDLKISVLLVILADINHPLEFVKQSLLVDSVYHWSRALAASSLVNREVFSETICKPT